MFDLDQAIAAAQKQKDKQDQSRSNLKRDDDQRLIDSGSERFMEMVGEVFKEDLLDGLSLTLEVNPDSHPSSADAEKLMGVFYVGSIRFMLIPHVIPAYKGNWALRVKGSGGSGGCGFSDVRKVYDSQSLLIEIGNMRERCAEEEARVADYNTQAQKLRRYKGEQAFPSEESEGFTKYEWAVLKIALNQGDLSEEGFEGAMALAENFIRVIGRREKEYEDYAS